jgi:hypothetical protein
MRRVYTHQERVALPQDLRRTHEEVQRTKVAMREDGIEHIRTFAGQGYAYRDIEKLKEEIHARKLESMSLRRELTDRGHTPITPIPDSL